MIITKGSWIEKREVKIKYEQRRGWSDHELRYGISIHPPRLILSATLLTSLSHVFLFYLSVRLMPRHVRKSVMLQLLLLLRHLVPTLW